MICFPISFLLWRSGRQRTGGKLSALEFAVMLGFFPAQGLSPAKILSKPFLTMDKLKPPLAKLNPVADGRWLPHSWGIRP
jgi:hypothetical protein